MKQVQGNKTTIITTNQILELSKNATKVILDLGTGDGNFIYKQALNNPSYFYIGVEPSLPQIKIFSKKALKNKLSNSLFINSSFENLVLPNAFIDEIYINLPWGNLMQVCVNPTVEQINKLESWLKPIGKITMHFGYSIEAEQNQTQKLSLPILTKELIEKLSVNVFEEQGFKLQELKELTKQDLQEINSTWAKKLKFRQERPFFKLALNL